MVFLPPDRVPAELFAGRPGYQRGNHKALEAMRTDFIEMVQAAGQKGLDSVPNDAWSMIGMAPPALLNKDITTGTPLDVAIPTQFGFSAVDYSAPARLLYPSVAPLRGIINRTKGIGQSATFTRVLGITNSRTAGVASQSMFTNEFEGQTQSTWSSTYGGSPIPNVGQMVADRITVPYRIFEYNASVSLAAELMGNGFQDNAGLTTLTLMQMCFMGEEQADLSAFSSALSAPGAPTLTARTAGTGETGLAASTLWVKVTAATLFGETAGSTAVSQAATSGQVIDVKIPDVAGATGYNVYVSTGSSDPGDASRYFVGNTGWNRFTIDGGYATSGNTVPTTDTGTGNSEGYDGLISILSGNANSTYDPKSLGVNTGYYQRFNGGSGSTLAAFGFTDLQAALLAMYQKNQANPDDVWMAPVNRKDLSDQILAASGANQAYRIELNQDEAGGVTVGSVATSIYNETTGKVVNLKVHPYLPQGNALILSYTLPQISYSEVTTCFEKRMVQDMLAIAWQPVSPRYRYTMYSIGTLCAQAPQFSGLIQGIPSSAAAPYS